MPTIAIVDGVILVLYNNDHPLPHIHARQAEHRCTLSILTGEVIGGTLPPAKLAAVQAWLESHREQVEFAWHELRNGRSMQGKIE